MGTVHVSEEIKKIFQEFGKRGGEATKRKYGARHFSTAGKLGMAKRWGTSKRKSMTTDP